MELEFDNVYHAVARKKLEEREVFWGSFMDRWKNLSGASEMPSMELPDSSFANSNSSFTNLHSAAKNIAMHAINLQPKSERANQKPQYTSNVGKNKTSNIKKGMIKRKSKESANVEKLDPLLSTAATTTKINKNANQRAQYTSNVGKNKQQNAKKGMVKRKSEESANVEKLNPLDSTKNIAMPTMNSKSKNKTSNQKTGHTSNIGKNKLTPSIEKRTSKRKSKESLNVEKYDTLESTATTAMPAINLPTKNKISIQKANVEENKLSNIRTAMVKKKSSKNPVYSKESANVEKLDSLDSNHNIEPDILNAKVSGNSKKQDTSHLIETGIPNNVSPNQDPEIIENPNKRPRVLAEEVIFLAEIPAPKKPKYMMTDRGRVRPFFIY